MNSLEELRNRCEVVPFSGCWIWMGGLTSNGYGYITRLRTSVHRLAFRLAYGRDASGLVCHHCDIKCCVNPDHLYDGTKSTNQKDAIKRGLSKNPPRPPSAATDKQVYEVARLIMLGVNLAKAARQVGLYRQFFDKSPRKEQLQEFMDKLK